MSDPFAYKEIGDGDLIVKVVYFALFCLFVTFHILLWHRV